MHLIEAPHTTKDEIQEMEVESPQEDPIVKTEEELPTEEHKKQQLNSEEIKVRQMYVVSHKELGGDVVSCIRQEDLCCVHLLQSKCATSPQVKTQAQRVKSQDSQNEGGAMLRTRQLLASLMWDVKMWFSGSWTLCEESSSFSNQHGYTNSFTEGVPIFDV